MWPIISDEDKKWFCNIYTSYHKIYRQVMELEEALLLFEELQKEDNAPNNSEMQQLLVRLLMDKFELKGLNLGLVFISRRG